MSDILPAKPDPWERQPGEGTRAFRAFCSYRDLGPARSFAKLARINAEGIEQKVVQLKGLYAKWSMQHGWVHRAAAWDDEQDRLLRIEMHRAAIRASKRHAADAFRLRRKAIARLRKMDPTELGPRELLAFITQSIRLERDALGMDVAGCRMPSEARPQLTLDDIQSLVEEYRETESATENCDQSDSR